MEHGTQFEQAYENYPRTILDRRVDPCPVRADDEEVLVVTQVGNAADPLAAHRKGACKLHRDQTTRAHPADDVGTPGLSGV